MTPEAHSVSEGVVKHKRVAFVPMIDGFLWVRVDGLPVSRDSNRGHSIQHGLALFRSLCNKRQLSHKNKFDKLFGMFRALVSVAFRAQNFA